MFKSLRKKLPLFFWLDDINTTKFSCIVYVTYQLAQLPLYKAAVVNLLHLRIPFSTLDKSGYFQKTPKLPCNPATALLGICLKETKTYVCTKMGSALSVIDPIQKQPRYSPTGDTPHWHGSAVKKNELLTCTPVWMDLRESCGVRKLIWEGCILYYSMYITFLKWQCN